MRLQHHARLRTLSNNNKMTVLEEVTPIHSINNSNNNNNNNNVSLITTTTPETKMAVYGNTTKMFYLRPSCFSVVEADQISRNTTTTASHPLCFSPRQSSPVPF